MDENGKGDVPTTRARRAAASTGATVRRTGRGIRAKAYGKLVEVHERMHAEAEAAAAAAEPVGADAASGTVGESGTHTASPEAAPEKSD
jgi:hypothetical protein